MKPPVDLSLFPDLPGIYKMFNSSGTIIYIGKAKNIKKRVRQYFQGGRPLDTKTSILVRHIHTIEYMVTQSEQDALLLEAQLIREFQPRYNINLKDDRHYPYIKLTNEPFPRLMVVRRRDADGASYYGPFPSLGSTRMLARQLSECFQLRDCHLVIDVTHRQPKCIKLDMGKCLGPCIDKTTYATYHHRLDQLKKVLVGRHHALIQELTVAMTQAAEAMRFERAAEWRDLIQAIETIGPRQTVFLDLPGRTSVWGVASLEGTRYVMIQTFIEGRLLYQQGYYDDREDWEGFAAQCLLDYTDRHGWPDRLVADQGCVDALADSVAVYPHTAVMVPQKGLKWQVLQQAQHNAQVALKRVLKSPSWATPVPEKSMVLDDLQHLLGLSQRPDRLIGFDISHLQGQDIVASAVYFKQGVPRKSLYRQLAIRSVSETSDDPRSIEEAVSRRLQRCFVDHEPLPQLLVIDGGKPQLHAAYRALQDLGLADSVGLMALAKQQELIYQMGRDTPIGLPEGHPVLRLLQWVRDESHRFANRFQQLKRSKRLTRSVLDDVPGLGPVRLKRLMAHFKTVAAIQSASAEDIASLGRVPPSVALMIKSTLLGKTV